MRTFPLLIIGCFLITCTFAQTEETYIVKTGEILPAKMIYALPEFTEGTAFMRDGSTATQRFNFNCFTGAMQFIDQEDDTLDVAEPGLIKDLTIDSLVFYYDKNFLLETFSARQFKIAKLQILVKVSEKIGGGYGTANESVSVTKYGGIYSVDGFHNLRADRDIELKKAVTWYIGNGFNLFLKAEKKAFISFFSKKRVLLEDYIKANKIDFKKEADLTKLLRFCVE